MFVCTIVVFFVWCGKHLYIYDLVLTYIHTYTLTWTPADTPTHTHTHTHTHNKLKNKQLQITDSPLVYSFYSKAVAVSIFFFELHIYKKTSLLYRLCSLASFRTWFALRVARSTLVSAWLILKDLSNNIMKCSKTN